VELRVSDEGPGMTAEERARAFDRFWQSAPARRDGRPNGHFGLGLSIVRSILRLHGCSIRAESQVGRGTTFTFTLPVASAEGEDDGGFGVAQAEPPSFEPPAPPEPPATQPSQDGTPPPRPRFRIIRRG
jgi:two-component system sensor histidine kinase BaeS